jgi:glucokinase
MLAFSLDMGGTHIGCAVVRDQKILACTSLVGESANGVAPILPLVAQTLQRLLNESGESLSACAGLAIGFPGIIDARTNTILSTLKKYEDAMELDFGAWSKEVLDLPLRMENNARMALLGEQFAGSARGLSDVVMMTLGTGIGGAAMIHGKLLRGAHAQAACLSGHLPIHYQGRLCKCGNIGCAEAEASGWALPGIIREHQAFATSLLAMESELNFRTLFDTADRGDHVALEVRQHCLEVWAANEVASIHAYDPEVVIMGGGVLARADVILPFVQSHITKYAWAAWGTPVVLAAELGEKAALLGAVPLLVEEH